MLRVIVPTLNAARDWPQFVSALLACILPEQVLTVDSESTDGTLALALTAGFQTCSVAPDEFNHGGAAEMLPDAEILTHMT